MWTDRQPKLSKTGVKWQLIAAFMRQRKTGIIAFKPFQATLDYGMLSMSESVANMNVRWDFKNGLYLQRPALTKLVALAGTKILLDFHRHNSGLRSSSSSSLSTTSLAVRLPLLSN